MYFDQSRLPMVGQPESAESMPGMINEYVQMECILADGGDRFGVCALAFDLHEELLWMGNQGGHVTSYYTNQLQKYTSFHVHPNQDIRQILPLEHGVLILSASLLRYQMRRGLPIFSHMSDNLSEMQCMLQISPSRLLLAGHQEKLIDYNLDVGQETKLVEVGETGCAMLRAHNRFVCAGNALGRIDLRDPNTLHIEHVLDTHSGNLSDFDVQGNLLVTCGFSNRQGILNVDRYLRVYDLRMMRAVSPIQTVVDPMYLRFLPLGSSRLAVVSAAGQLQLLDTVAFSEPRLCLVQMENPGAMCLSFDISTSSQALAFGDNSGSIHLFGSRQETVFNTYSRPSEHPDVVSPIINMSVNDYESPFSSIPMPLVSSEMSLASDWPQHLMQSCYRRSPAIDPEILRTMKMQGPIGYAPNPKVTRRNQVSYNLEGSSGGAIPRLKNYERNHTKATVVDESGVFVAIPKRYRRVELKYNKLGVEDFQFDMYNKTGLAGLEAILPNAYCNPMIQVLYYIEPLRATLLSHICQKEFCLSCELGFLFHMLANPSSTPCQPGNFLRAFRTVPEASALGLILSDMHAEVKQRFDLGMLIQCWNRFILHQMDMEILETRRKQKDAGKVSRKPFVYKEVDFPAIINAGHGKRVVSATTSQDVSARSEIKPEEVTEIHQIFAMKQWLINSCLKCKFEVRKEAILMPCNLNYPTGEPEKDYWPFCDILRRSLNSDQVTPAWCDRCSKFSPTSQCRRLSSLPQVLSINTSLHNPQNKSFWQSQMDKKVSKAHAHSEQPNRATTPNSMGSTKPCRYGDNCTRPGCRFRHSFDSTPPPLSHTNPYCSNNWLPHRIRMLIKDNDLIVQKVADEDINSPSTHASAPASKGGFVEYHLTAIVCYITEPSTIEKRSLVALVKVPANYLADRQRKNDSMWYLFNDFSITPVPPQEATWFSLDWKTPCVLYYSTEEVYCARTEVKQNLNKDIFSQVMSSITRGARGAVTFTPLEEHEYPKMNELVAMDAEFVTLNQEEAELRSDGKMSTIKPSHLSVARITCIRGQGPLEGTPFIDDYISTQEQVVDYLTKFSGIKPGDLDANFSSKHLTTLKSTYIKLRYLQDSGVIFVGHGLKNDFRVINLVVPPEQVVDTVVLFHLPHHRMVSLRFLAWHFLGLKIQSETHDSTEDARAALQLYRCYKRLESEGRVVSALSELYELGKSLNWKVPSD